MSEARVRVSLSDGVLEFEGSESFVTTQVEKFASIIKAALAAEQSIADVPRDGGAARTDTGRTDAGGNGAGGGTQPAATAPPSPAVEFKDIFAPTDTGVQILKALPGSSRAEKAVNGAKLYLYGLLALTQRDTALFAEIRNVCKAHGCYDSHNMAACFKDDQASFVFGGRGKSQTLKLSAPGIHATAELIARLRARGNGIASKRKGNAGNAVQTTTHARVSSRRRMATLVRSS